MATLNADNGNTAAIRYEVVKNHAQSKLKGINVYNARVQATTKSLREVAETMVREGCKYDSAEVVAILEKFADVTTRLLQEGNAVNVGSLVRFRPSIRGNFASADTAFSKADHRVVVSAAIGSALRNVAAGAPVMRISAVPLPEIHNVYNGTTGAKDTICLEGPLVILGKRFIWDETAEDEGFFIDVAGDLTKCDAFSVDAARTSVFVNTTAQITEGLVGTLIFATRNTSSGDLATITYAEPLEYEETTA